MTFDRGRRAPVLSGLVALAVGAMVAGGATAVRHGALDGWGGEMNYAADVHQHAPAAQDAPAPGLTDAQAPGGGAGGSRTTTTTTPTTTTTAKPPTTTSKPPTHSSAPSTSKPRLAPTQTEQVLSLVNQVRAQRGCAPLTSDSRLADAAQGHSSDMARRGYFSHTTPEGKTFDKRIKSAGYPQPGAENIAMGQRSADEVMNAWMHSDGHRHNILNCDLSTIGVGLDTDGWYWTQDFGY